MKSNAPAGENMNVKFNFFVCVM